MGLLLLAGTTALGTAAGMVAGPLNDWLLAVWGGAPGFLRLASNLPGWLAVVVLGCAGLYFGGRLATWATRDALALEVGFAGLTIKQYGSTRHLPRGEIAAIVLDGKDLVLFDAAGRQLARHDATGLNRRKLESVLTSLGYPFMSVGDATGSNYWAWVEGHPDLDPQEHQLMRNRVQALRERDFLAAAGFTDELTERGVVVRERHRVQEFRRANPLRR